MYRPASAALLGIGLLTVVARGQQPSQKFQSGVEVVPIDVTVVDDSGRPLEGLAPTDIIVRIDGRPRRVMSAAFISQATTLRQAASIPVPDGYGSNEVTRGGRLIVIVIDQPNLPFTALIPLQKAAGAFIDRLTASDRVAVVGLGLQAPSVSFTNDLAKVKNAIAHMAGQQSADRGMGFAAALAIDRGEQGALTRLTARDCLDLRTRLSCMAQLRGEAEELAREARRDAELSLGGLGGLLKGMKGIDAPKTVILISHGFMADAFQRGDGVSRLMEIGALATAARTSVYGIKLEEMPDDITAKRQVLSAGEEAGERRRGLETLALSTRGAVFNITGPGTGAFDHLTAELSGSYLLGVESDAGDRTGSVHAIAVTVPRRGAIMRSHRRMIVADRREASRSPLEAVKSALESPLIVSTLALRGTVLAVRGAEPSRLQLLVHADVGSDYTTRQRLPVGFVVFDPRGREVGSELAEVQLEPVSPGAPSSLAFNAGASVEPGEYVVKIAVADGERVGTIQLSAHASLVTAGAVTLSELIAGGAVPPGDLLHPTVGSRVASGWLHGYFEAYGRDLDALQVRFEIAADEGAPALLSAAVGFRPAGIERALFSQMMPVQLLPPGLYGFRAVVSAGGVPVKILTRGFEIPALQNEAASGALFLPVARETLSRSFSRTDALNATTRQIFRERVPADARELFDRGLSYLQSDRVVEAGASFKEAIRPGAAGSAALAYLGACFAATGHDTEAAQLWRAAIAEAGDLPHLHQWLGEALMRSQAFGEARAVFEEAGRRWPSDARFARPLALLHAISGRGADAVRSMEQVISADPADVDALFLALEWLFRLRRGGIAVHSAAEDLQLARTYADSYSKANGPKQPLVSRWLAYLQQPRAPPVR